MVDANGSRPGHGSLCKNGLDLSVYQSERENHNDRESIAVITNVATAANEY